MDGTTIRHLDPRMLHTLEWIDNQSHRVKSVLTWLFKRGGKGDPMQDWEEYDKIKKPKLLVRRALHKILQRKEVEQYVEPCPGAYLVLDFLKKNNIPMALASNSLGEGYGHEILGTFDLEKYFLATIFREDIRKSKPSPEGILLAIQKTGVQLTENDIVWHIGDQHKDIKAAIAAQEHLPCPIVPIAYALNAALAIVEHNLSPDHIIPSYFDMHEKLKKILPASKQARTLA
jgi:phosphoglycolate phosphatase